jgi:hypothetical protein
MLQYDLGGLAPRSFEKMVQALAVGALGIGVTVFGDGPDGGREASFEGRVLPLTQGDPWVGYGVIQAKFKQRSAGPAADADWLVDEIRKEGAAYANRRRGVRRPEYFIIASNVVLSAVSHSGGKDRVRAALNTFAEVSGLRGWEVWDYDQIGALLDNNEAVRHAYAAFITAGDVLASVMSWLNASRPDFGDVIANFLSKELLNAQYANLEQAGYAGDERVPLAQVFVDLPASTTHKAEPTDDDDDDEEHFAAAILDTASEKLDPRSIALGDRQIGKPAASPLGRYVLIGGPGQGKTTIGQFTCQLFRAALLTDRPAHLLSPETLFAINAIKETTAAEGIVLPKARRFPLHVTLSEFAAALGRARACNEAMSLLQFLVDKVSRRTSTPILTSDFREWLGAYAWLLVLDGLDEVPTSSNRADVLSEVENFWIDLAQLNADVLIVATSRPQGYNDDFAPLYYVHLWLTPLSPRRALHYANRLVAVRFTTAADRSERLLHRLEEAASIDATAKLMRSPLQVTIMSTLLDQIGRAPQDRWRLFYEYYQAIYRREMERETPAAPLLSQYRSDIDVIHARVALSLQIDCETVGGSDARLSREQFKSIVINHLDAKGFERREVASLTEAIIEAAETRLVFLVSPSVGTIAFEIRSLQEFMAAQALMSGETGIVRDRLRAIAPVVSWSNVFVFAAGRCVVQDDYLLDSVYRICAEMNAGLGSEVDKIVCAGSSLALDLLEDGVGDRQPRFARLLMGLAFGALEGASTSESERLAAFCNTSNEGEFQETLRARLTEPARDVRLNAWSLLLQLIARGIAWAEQLATQFWPIEDSRRLEICGLGPAKKALAWIQPRAVALLERYGFEECWFMYSMVRADNTGAAAFPSWVRGVFEGLLAGRAEILALGVRGAEPLTLSLRPVSIVAGFWSQLTECNMQLAKWVLIGAAAKFGESRDTATLAQFLRVAAGSGGAELFSVGDVLPWPARACLEWAGDPDELKRLATAVERGDFGDHEQWLAAEERWRNEGVTVADLIAGGARGPFSPGIGAVGFATYGCSVAGDEPSAEAVDALYAFYASTEEGHLRRLCAKALWWLYVQSTYHGSELELTLDQAEEILRDIPEGEFLDLEPLNLISIRATASGRFVDIADVLGRRRGRSEFLYSAGLLSDIVSFLLDALLREPRRLGLLRLLPLAFGSRGRPSRKIRSLAKAEFDAIYPDKYEGDDILCALRLRIALGGLQPGETEALASLALAATNGDVDALRLVGDQAASSSQIDLAMSLILAIHSETSPETRPRWLGDTMSQLRARRTSGLRARAEELELGV